ncbi:hypothetical protein N7454_002341 [Penicillium verhagenii]|nr:hypothetical protein N7454_002341 [Penicillium verhagenii]
MTFTQLQTRPAELWHQSTDKMHRSTTDIWRRSTNLWYDSKDKCQQTTVNAWHRSTDSWTSSMSRHRQSTSDKSTDQSSHTYTVPDNGTNAEDKAPITSTAIIPSYTPSASAQPAFQPPHNSSYPFSPESFGSPDSPQSLQFSPAPQIKCRRRSQSEADTRSTSSSIISIDLQTDKKTVPDQKIKDLIEMNNKIEAQLEQVKQLRSSKSGQLGEIEYNWISSTIIDMEESKQEVTRVLDYYRLILEKHKGKLNSSGHKRWRTRDCQRIREEYPRFRLHQSRLEKVLNHISSLVAIPEALPEEKWGVSLSDLPYCKATIKSLVELPVNCEIAVSTPVIAELPSELTSVASNKRVIPIPKIIVTQAVEDLLEDQKRSKEMEDLIDYENKEMDEMMAWEQTRNDIQVQQSESLARIVAEMEKRSR